MELNQAVQNLQQASNPNYGEMPADALARKLKQLQFQNLDTQQKNIGKTQAQIEQMRGQQTEAPAMDPAKWGLLADLFAPKGERTNFAQVGAALGPKDTSKQELYNLQKQLSGQEKNLSNTIGKIDLNEPKSYEHLYKLERMRHANKMAQKDAGSDVAEPTIGQDAVDKDFGKDYSSWVSGGFSNVQGNLEKLKSAQVAIDDKDTEMGKRIMPQFVRKRTAPESVEVEQNVANVVFQSLKQILGGQFTEKEGERLVEQTYDSGLSDAENSKKVKSAYDTLERMAAAKQEAVDFFQKTGTLTGFKGGTYSGIDDYMKMIKERELGGDNDDAMYRQIIGGK